MGYSINYIGAKFDLRDVKTDIKRQIKIMKNATMRRNDLHSDPTKVGADTTIIPEPESIYISSLTVKFSLQQRGQSWQKSDRACALGTRTNQTMFFPLRTFFLFKFNPSFSLPLSFPSTPLIIISAPISPLTGTHNNRLSFFSTITNSLLYIYQLITGWKIRLSSMKNGQWWREMGPNY